MNTPESFTYQESDSFDFIKEIRYYIFFWPWFLTSVLVMFICAFLYLRYSNNTYATSASLLVKDSKNDPSNFLTQSSGAMFNYNSINIDNFIAQISANNNLKAVVRALDLQTKIYVVGRVNTNLAYGNNIPFRIQFKTDKTFENPISIKITDKKATLDYRNKHFTLIPGQAIELETFRLTLTNMPKNNLVYHITRTTEADAIDKLAEEVAISSKRKKGDNIEIYTKGPNIKRNEAIINTLIEMAHKDQVNEKREIYGLTIDFINSRLKSIVIEIDSLSLKTTGFKSDNLIFSPEIQTTNALNNLTNLEQEKFNLTTQLELTKSLQQNLQSQPNFSLLPSNIGISNTNVNELVMAYNTLILKRNNLLLSATERNPIIIQLSTELTDLKQNIHRSIDNYLDNIETSLSKFSEFKNSTSDKVSKIPLLNATLQGFERKFQIAENLYLFLLQKREEASISFEATMPDTRVINYATTNKVPVAPKSSLILLSALLIGLLIPLGLLYILKIFDTKVHTREDLEEKFNGINILGEIPFVQETSSIFDSRSLFAESARIIRSNINYKLPENDGCKTILTTSSIKGEGKTLTNFNMAASYVASGKKVLIIGADLRNPKVHSIVNISRKTNEKGLSSLLVDSNLASKALITTIDLFNDKLDILLSGPIPPNPAELLGSTNFDNLLESLKKDYDYIFIDSAPIILVSDTIPLIKHADLVIYTTRANVTDKKIGEYAKNLINDKKIQNIGLILNGIKTGSHSYYQYGYSYRYSYAYQYGYGYGYGKDEKV